MGSLFFLIVYSVLIVVPFFQLWKRTGHNGWMALFMAVPVVNLIMLYVLAFKRWPALDHTNVPERFE